jgi:hypothetical protein
MIDSFDYCGQDWNLLAVLTEQLQFARFFNFLKKIHPTASDEAPIEPKNAKGSMNMH